VSWSNGLPTIICEECGIENKPENTVWFQGEVGVCRNKEICEQNQAFDRWRKDHLTDLKDETSMTAEFPNIVVEDLNPYRFQDKARQIVLEYYNHNFVSVYDELHISDIVVSSFTKTLQNWKALVITNVANDNLYFEVTYDGDKKQAYLDVYSKAANVVFPDTGHIEETNYFTPKFQNARG
jgi:hypothetical protein